MILRRKTTIFIILVGTVLAIGYYVFFISVRPAFQERIMGKVFFTESVECNNKKYIFETVESKTLGWPTNVYIESSLPENFIAVLTPPKEEGFENIYFVISASKKNCNRIYLTRGFPTDVAERGIYEWQVSTNKIRELAISNEFGLEYIPIPLEHTTAVAPDGEKILVSQRADPHTSQDFCDFRILKLLNLDEDKLEILVQLPRSETFDNGFTELSPYCNGLSFGWSDKSTIYYDIYDATAEVSYINNIARPVIERRTLVLP